uniref:Sulfatase N-terminal domain-containing protein n=1 Tax=Clytia hemisphaerica TaxID=252671 RepID=A0A7M5V4Y6_9CNID
MQIHRQYFSNHRNTDPKNQFYRHRKACPTPKYRHFLLKTPKHRRKKGSIPTHRQTRTPPLVTVHAGEDKPNIVVLLADDVGIGDIGCYGNGTINTPNIDRLCQKGVKMEHNYAAAPLCTPSRASLMTGRYPVRVGYVARTKDVERVTIYTSATGGLPQSETTFAEIFKQHGYTNGFFGKWHLGLHCGEKDFCHHPMNNGFDHYYGMPLTNLKDCGDWSIFDIQSEAVMVPNPKHVFALIIILAISCFVLNLISLRLFLVLFLIVLGWYLYHIGAYYFHRQFNCIVMKDKQVVQQTVDLEHLTGHLVGEVKSFIRQNAENPFLAYVAFHKAHVALANPPRFQGVSEYGSYGDTMAELDWAVGEIVNYLDDLNLTKNTIIYFMSDHGPAKYAYNTATGEYQGGWAGIYRGGKGYNYQGGIRVPKIVQWQGKISGGKKISRPSSHMDMFPTLLSMANIPYDGSALDGEDTSMLMMGDSQASPDRIFYHYCGIHIHAVSIEEKARNQVWVVHFIIPVNDDGHLATCYGDDVIVLDEPDIYELVQDPSESNPLDRTDPNYERVLNLARLKATEFNATVDFSVPNQLSHEMNSFSIDRAPCCNEMPNCIC